MNNIILSKLYDQLNNLIDLPVDLFQSFIDNNIQDVYITTSEGHKILHFPAILYDTHTDYIIKLDEYFILYKYLVNTKNSLYDFGDDISISLSKQLTITHLPRNQLLIDKIIKDTEFFKFFITRYILFIKLISNILNNISLLEGYNVRNIR